MPPFYLEEYGFREFIMTGWAYGFLCAKARTLVSINSSFPYVTEGRELPACSKTGEDPIRWRPHSLSA